MSGLPNIGDVVANRYRVGALIEQAPAYSAFRVTDLDVEVDVALWWMKSELLPDDRKRDAFIGAVVDMRGLIHPHLRRLYDAGRRGEDVYLTTQLSSVEGMLLRLGTGRRSPEIDVIRYANAMAEALDAAHKLGHVHGWMVPWDIVQVAGQIKIGGVGLYRDVDMIAARGCWRDWERYVAPEVREAGLATPASDVYSMSAILVEIASGLSVPDLGESTEALASEQIKLADVLAQGLSLSPDRRPQTPDELGRRMREVMVDERIPTAERAAQEPPPGVGLPLSLSDDDETIVYNEGAKPLANLGENEEPPTTIESPRARQSKVTDPMYGGSLSSGSMALPTAIGDEESAPTVIDPPEGVSDHGGTRRGMAGSLPTAIGEQESQPTAIENPAVPMSGEPPPPAGDRSSSRTMSNPPQFVSMKPPSEPGKKSGTPVIAAIDQPGMKPRVRSIAESMGKPTAPAGSLGNYAPPRTSGGAPSGSKLWLVVLGVAVLVAGAIAATYFLTGG